MKNKIQLLYYLFFITVIIFRDLKNENWTEVYNGTETRWLVTDLTVGASYEFRVSAVNEMGYSPLSGSSKILKYDPGYWKALQCEFKAN